MTGSRGPTIDEHVLVVAVLVLTGVLLVLVVALLTGRWWLRRAGARRAGRIERARPLLVRLAAGEGDEDATLDELAALPRGTWRPLEPVVVDLLGKLRGEAHGALVRLLERRGTRQRALRSARHRRATARANSAHLLGALGGPGALPRLVLLLADRDEEVRAVAVRALGRLGDPAAAVALVSALVGSGRPLPHHAVMAALRRIGPAAWTVLRSFADHPDPLVRARVAEAMGLVGAVRAASTLVTMLAGDPADEVRLRAARALGALGAPGAVDALLAATDAGEPTALRVTAAQALGALGSRAAVPVLRALVADPHHWVAHTAAAALVDVGPAGTAALQELAEDSRTGATHALEALATTGGGVA